jgi:hypothetical protein
VLAAKVANGVLCPVTPVILTVGNEKLATYTKFDTGSNCDAIVPTLVRKLNIEPKIEPKTVVTFGGKSTLERSLVSFEVTSFVSDACISAKNALVSEILTTSNNRPRSNEDVEGLESMEGIVSFQELDDELIGVILSAKHTKHWVGGEILQGGLNQPMAMRTDFGWTLLGSNPTKEVDEKAFNCCVVEDELSSFDEDFCHYACGLQWRKRGSTDSKDSEAFTLFNYLCTGVTVGSSIHVIPPAPPGDGNNLRNAWQKT